MEIEQQRHQVIKRVTICGAIVNCLLAGCQVVFGIIGHSQALLADGFHTLSDLFSDFIVLFAVSQSSHAADDRRFGPLVVARRVGDRVHFRSHR